MKRFFLAILLTLVCLPMVAQQMSVVEFTRLNGCKVKTDKSAAMLDLYTDQDGFSFFADGTQEVKPQEWVGFVRLRLPGKTTRVLIRHPKFGQLLWYVPGHRKLRKRQHYQAALFASDPTVDYKATHQWVVFRLNPENMLLQVDSTVRQVRQPVVEYCLKLGTHKYRAEAPFFEAQEGSFTLTDSARTDISLNLHPFYSYLTVKSVLKGGKLYIDNTLIKKGEATSYKLTEGFHRVDLLRGKVCVYDSLLFLRRSEKKVLDITEDDLYKWSMRPDNPFSLDIDGPSDEEIPETSVLLSCQDSLAQIWVDREYVGTGQWEGKLPRGYHLVQSVKDGEDNVSAVLWVKNDFPVEFTLPATGLGYGLLNIHCNVEGASIRIDGKEYGETPQLIRLEATRSYEITLYKAGYNTVKRQVRPKGNGEVDVYMQLKRK